MEAIPSSTESRSRTSRRINSTFGSEGTAPRTVPNVRNPFCASAAAVALPMPEETPVTKATFIVTPLDDIHHPIVQKKLTARCESLDVNTPGGAQDRAPQLIVGDRTRDGERSRHSRKKNSGFSAPLFLGRATHESAHRGRDILHFAIERQIGRAHV